jgi:phosphoribosylformylglycinamidine synthase
MSLARLYHLSLSDGTPRRAAVTALVVGPLLTLINQADAVIAGDGLNWIKVVLTFVVPYVVATIGAVGAKWKDEGSAAPARVDPCHDGPGKLNSGQIDSAALEDLPVRARIHVTLKNGVLDPQGKAIENALAALGFEGVEDVRQGKVIEFSLAEEDPETARSTVRDMCDRLLANTVIENYAIELDGDH